MTEYRDPTPNNFPDDYEQSQVDKRVLQRTKAVREKMYGLDTREAMAQAEEITSVVANEAKEIAGNTETRQTDLENRYEDQIAGNTDIDEVIDARRPDGMDAYPTLNKRLDEQFGKDSEFRSFETDSSHLVRVLHEHQERGVNPLWFGAIGDGVTDDGLAIKACHEYANTNGLKVKYPAGYTFNISEVSEILIKTDTDFSGAKLKINDNPSTVNRNESLFIVPDESVQTHDNDDLTTQLSGLMKRGFRGRIPGLASGKRQFVQIYDDDDLILNRYGDHMGGDAKPRSDMFRVDPSGYIMDDLIYDFTKVTRAVVHDVPLRPLFLKFGEVETYGTNVRVTGVYFNRNFKIQRSNVIVDSMSYVDLDDGPNKQSRRGIINTENCCQISILNFNGVPSLSQGSYIISNYRTLRLFLGHISCDGGVGDRWSAHVSYYCKNITVFNAEINDIDAHDPMANLYILGSKIGSRGVRVTGFGDLVIRDTEFKSQTALILRDDYGSSWNGDIIIDNVVHRPLNIIEARFISLRPHVDHDFGVPTTLGRDLVQITNLRIADRTQSLDRYALINIDCGTDDLVSASRDYFKLCPRFKFSNIKREGFNADDNNRGIIPLWIRGFKNLRGHSDSYFNANMDGSIDIRENITIEIEDTKLDESLRYQAADSNRISNLIQPVPSDIFNYNYARNYANDYLCPKFVLTRCRGVYASLKGLRGIINARDSTIRASVNLIGGGSQSKTLFDNCIIEPFFDRESDPKYVIRGSRSLNTYNNCEFRLPIHQLGRVSPDSTHVLMVYEIFANITNQSNISIGAKLVNCTFSYGMDLSLFNDKLELFTRDIGTTGPGVLLRNFGPAANRPTVGLYPGATYFNTDTNALMIWDGNQWR